MVKFHGDEVRAMGKSFVFKVIKNRRLEPMKGMKATPTERQNEMKLHYDDTGFALQSNVKNDTILMQLNIVERAQPFLFLF